MFFKKKQEQPHKTYDHENKKPMIKASICNGEQVAGFKDVHTGTFEEVMLIRDSAFFRGEFYISVLLFCPFANIRSHSVEVTYPILV